MGLDVMDRKLLQAVLEKFGGGPVGVDNLAAAIGEERDTIEDVLEPYLIQQGYLQRTPRGRIATGRAWNERWLIRRTHRRQRSMRTLHRAAERGASRPYALRRTAGPRRSSSCWLPHGQLELAGLVRGAAPVLPARGHQRGGAAVAAGSVQLNLPLLCLDGGCGGAPRRRDAATVGPILFSARDCYQLVGHLRGPVSIQPWPAEYSLRLAPRPARGSRRAWPSSCCSARGRRRWWWTSPRPGTPGTASPKRRASRSGCWRWCGSTSTPTCPQREPGAARRQSPS
jgi:hypothetical protein